MYEGLTGDEIRARRPGWDVFRDGCPEGELPSDVAERMKQLLELLGDPGGDVVLFGHAHCLRALAVTYLALPIERASLLRLDTGTLSILGYERERRAITLWNAD